MSQADKLRLDAIRNTIFDIHNSATGVGENTRKFYGFLEIHAIHMQVMEKVSMPRSLIVPAHDTERHDGAPILDQHTWNNGVHRTFAGSDAIGMSRICPETHPPVL